MTTKRLYKSHKSGPLHTLYSGLGSVHFEAKPPELFQHKSVDALVKMPCKDTSMPLWKKKIH